MGDSEKLLSECSLEITPDVITMVTGLEQSTIKVGGMLVNTAVLQNTPNPTVIRIDYTQGLLGECYLIVDGVTREKLVSAMMGVPELEGIGLTDELVDSALCELMNQLSGSILSKAAEVSEATYDISPPTVINLDELTLRRQEMIVNLFHNPKYGISLKLVNNLEQSY